MRSDLSEASSVMVEGEGGGEREEVPGVALPGGMDPSPYASHWCREAEEAG